MPLSDLIPFGEWLPDQPDLNNPGATVAQNVYSKSGIYVPFKSLNTFSNDIGDKPLGAAALKDNDQVSELFCGTKDKLLQLSGKTFGDVSNGVYNTSFEGRWAFAQFGERVIACNGQDNVQTYNLGADTAFSDLYSSDFVAADLAVINEFVVYINTNDPNDGKVSNRAFWTAVGDPTDINLSSGSARITKASETLSDFQDLFDGDGGANMRIFGGQRTGIILQEKAIHSIQFVGGALAFQFDLLESGRGTKWPGSAVNVGGVIYFVDEDGFYAFDGARSINISENKVSRYFLDQWDANHRYNIRAAYDPLNNAVVWTYTSTSGGGSNDACIIYNITDGRWTYSNHGYQLLFNATTIGLTLEELGAIYNDLDNDVPVSLDSNQWKGGDARFAGFSSNQLGWFDGSNLTATLETSEVQLNQQGRAVLDAALPVVDSNTFGVRIKHRKLQGDSVTTSSQATQNSTTGLADFFIDDTYFRAQVELTTSWTKAQGVRYSFTNSGEF